MIQILFWGFIYFFSSLYSTSVTFHNKSNSIIDISVQSYATIEPFKELLCYIDDIKPNQTASCHIPNDRCLGTVFIHPGSSTKQVNQFKINPEDTCRDFEFTVTEQGGSFSIYE